MSEPGAGPSVVGGYRLVRRIGGGGMGDVHVAFDERLHRHVALKSIRPERRLHPEARDRFLREARLLSRLNHPGICAIYDYLERAEGDYLVLELIEGTELGAAMGALGRQEKLRVAREIADVLAAAHAAGIVHRDLKPANVMLTRSGQVKVLDFGLARLQGGEREVDGGDAAGGAERGTPSSSLFITLRDRTIVGTPGYMSPEQARGDPVGPASDMYCLGLLFQELFTGQRSHEPGLSVTELIERARSASTRPLVGLERDLSALIRQLEAQDPAARPTAAETIARLRWIQGRTARRTRRLVAGAVLALGIGATIKYTADLRRERADAVAARADADDLIVFLLGDLRERLAGVGRLDVLDSVTDKAREYLARLPEDAVDDDDLYRRSEVLRQIGMVRMAQGHMSAAETAFTDSLALAGDVVARHPERLRWLADLGASHYYLGYFRLERRDLAGAQEQFELYRGIADRLVALDGPKREWLLEQAYAHNNLGAVLEKKGEYASAIEEIERSLAIKRELVAAEPEEVEGLRSLANGLSWLATIQAKLGDPASAEASCSEELDIRLRLTEEDPLHAGDRQLRARAHAVRGEHRRQLPGSCEDALADFEDARALDEELVALDPSNLEWRRDLAVAHRLSADALLCLEEPDAALEELGAARAILGELVAREPQQAEWRAQLAQCGYLAGSAQLLRADWEEALSEARAAREALAPLTSRGELTPDNRYLLFDLRLVEATALEAGARRDEARAVREEALAALEPLAAAAATPAAWSRMALALLQLERAEAAEPYVRRLEGTGSWSAELEGLAIRNGIALHGSAR